MSNIDKQALREAAEKALNARARLALMQSVFDDDGDDVKPEAQEDISICVSFNDLTNPAAVLALLDELEAAERERESWRTSFDNERFRADKLAEAFKTEHEQLVMSNTALITQHMRANGAERCIAELESNPIATLDVQSGRGDGNKFALVYSSAAHKLPDDVYYLCVVPAAAGKGE